MYEMVILATTWSDMNGAEHLVYCLPTTPQRQSSQFTVIFKII